MCSSLFSPPTQCLQLFSDAYPISQDLHWNWGFTFIATHSDFLTGNQALACVPDLSFPESYYKPSWSCNSSILHVQKSTKMTPLSSTANPRYSMVSYHSCRSLHVPWQLNLGKYLPNHLGFFVCSVFKLETPSMAFSVQFILFQTDLDFYKLETLVSEALSAEFFSY